MARKEYKTVRIYPEDAKKLKGVSYRTGLPVVKLIAQATSIIVRAQKLSYRLNKPIDQVLEEALDYVEYKNKEFMVKRRAKQLGVDWDRVKDKDSLLQKHFN